MAYRTTPKTEAHKQRRHDRIIREARAIAAEASPPIELGHYRAFDTQLAASCMTGSSLVIDGGWTAQ